MSSKTKDKEKYLLQVSKKIEIAIVDLFSNFMKIEIAIAIFAIGLIPCQMIYSSFDNLSMRSMVRWVYTTDTVVKKYL